MEWLSLLFLILAASAMGLSGRAPTVPLSLFFALLTILLLRTARERRRSDLLNQIKSQRRVLRSGGSVIIEGQLVTASSVLTTYSITVGGVLCNINLPSPFFLQKDPSHALLCSGLSLLTGWCALPHGPMLTALSITTNLLGGEELLVADLVGAEEAFRPVSVQKLPPEPSFLLVLLLQLLPEKNRGPAKHPSKLPEQLEEMARRKKRAGTPESPPPVPPVAAPGPSRSSRVALQDKQRFPR